MNAHEFTFGIEIETIAPDSAVRDHGLRIGGYRRGIQVPYLPTGWKAEADGSIEIPAGRTQMRGRQPGPAGGRDQPGDRGRSARSKRKATGSTSAAGFTYTSGGAGTGRRRLGPAGARSSRTSNAGSTRSPERRPANAAATAAGCGSTGTRKTPSRTSTATATTPST
jgi:hypothetical protein